MTKHCTKCGNSVEADHEYCINCGTGVRKEAESKQKAKKDPVDPLGRIMLFLVIIIVVFGAVAAIAIIASGGMNAGTSRSSGGFETSTVATDSGGLIETPTEQILTNWIEDIPTEYRLGDVAPTNVNVSNLVEGHKLNLIGQWTDSGTAAVFKFPTTGDAKEYYRGQINEIEEERGYTTMSTFGLSSECFGASFSGIVEVKEYICVHKNIYFKLKFTGYTVPSQTEIKNLLLDLESHIR